MNRGGSPALSFRLTLGRCGFWTDLVNAGRGHRRAPVFAQKWVAAPTGRRTARWTGPLTRMRSPRPVNVSVEQTGSVLHGTHTPRPDAAREPITYRILNNMPESFDLTTCVSVPFL